MTTQQAYEEIVSQSIRQSWIESQLLGPVEESVERYCDSIDAEIASREFYRHAAQVFD